MSQRNGASKPVKTHFSVTAKMHPILFQLKNFIPWEFNQLFIHRWFQFSSFNSFSKKMANQHSTIILSPKNRNTQETISILTSSHCRWSKLISQNTIKFTSHNVQHIYDLWSFTCPATLQLITWANRTSCNGEKHLMWYTPSVEGFLQGDVDQSEVNELFNPLKQKFLHWHQPLPSQQTEKKKRFTEFSTIFHLLWRSSIKNRLCSLIGFYIQQQLYKIKFAICIPTLAYNINTSLV
jgi:hypothetical protein